jgi:hypothetical protein
LNRLLPLLLALAAPLAAQDTTSVDPGSYPLLERARQREAERIKEAREVMPIRRPPASNTST